MLSLYLGICGRLVIYCSVESGRIARLVLHPDILVDVHKCQTNVFTLNHRNSEFQMYAICIWSPGSKWSHPCSRTFMHWVWTFCKCSSFSRTLRRQIGTDCLINNAFQHCRRAYTSSHFVRRSCARIAEIHFILHILHVIIIEHRMLLCNT